MYAAANLGAGAFALNDPYFRLYRDNLAAIEAWTQQQMAGRPGACVPETMRFNGVGIQFRGAGQPLGFNCDAASPPFFNARTLSMGAEVSLWMWRQFLATGDREFLERNYPVMAASARFLLAYAQPGPDGLLHTQPSNAHESQWDVRDPTTDVSAMDALFPAVSRAARLLHRDPDLVSAVEVALPRVPPLPRTDAATMQQLLPPSADGGRSAASGP
jgi:alpha-L-fucosidase 2